MLKAAENQQLEWDVVQTARELEFLPEESQRQLDTAVNWGRYAELLAYDDKAELIYLEPAGSAPTPELGSEEKVNGGPSVVI
jgi:NitT/TauT family transport system ATP-binding protein